MGHHSFAKNDQVTHPRNRPGAKDPTVAMTRDQFADVDDPQAQRAHLPERTVCSRCNAVVHNGLWKMDAGQKHLLLSMGAASEVVCPACRQVEEHAPEGVLTLRGNFLREHAVEIVHLIRNEADEALVDNPMERIIDLRTTEDEWVVETTNEKLAQRIGRAVYRAYKGDLDYHWGGGNHLARVDWTRDS